MKTANTLIILLFGVCTLHAIENNAQNPLSGVSEEVQQFLNQQVKSETQNLQKNKYTVDILGRKKNSKKVTLISNAKAHKEKKIFVDIIDRKKNDYIEKTASGKMVMDSHTGNSRLWFNGQELSSKDYDKTIKDFYGDRPYIPSVRTDSLSATEIKNLINGPDPVFISMHKKATSEMDVSSILLKSQITTHAFTNSAKGNGIGIYFQEVGGCPHPYYTNGYYVADSAHSCSSYSPHATSVWQIIKNTAPEATVFGFERPYGPGNPNNYSPTLEIATHSWSNDTSNSYTATDEGFDNDIYNNRIITFAAAGNLKSYMPTTNRNVKSPGKALNVIAVGAVDPQNDYYASYSQWNNSVVGNEKPEVANYTDFQLNHDYEFSYTCDYGTCYYDGFINGTSAATPYTAAMTADLLSQYSFFKRHPELVKALYLSSEKIPIPNASSHDPYNYTVAAKGIPVYSSLAWNHSFYWWNGQNNCCFDGNNKITFTEPINTGDHVRIAIAWLSNGTSLITNNYVIPQDIDLKVYQNGVPIETSQSSYNPFEVVDFTATSNDSLKIEIIRYSNNGSDNVILGYSLWVDR